VELGSGCKDFSPGGDGGNNVGEKSLLDRTAKRHLFWGSRKDILRDASTSTRQGGVTDHF